MKKLFFALVLVTSLLGAAEPSVSQAIEPEGKLNVWRFQAGGQMMGAIDTDRLLLGSGIFASAVRRVTNDSPVYVGIETGLLDTRDLAAAISYAFLFPLLTNSDVHIDSVRMIPVLPTAMIRDDSGGFHVYGGIAVGPTVQRVTAYSVKTGERKSTTEMGLMAIFRGGADIDLSDNVAINLELLRFGLLQNAFAYLPALSLSASF